MMSKSIIHIISSMTLVLILISVSTAQVKFGATYGITSSNMSVDPDSGDSFDSKLGFTIGGVIEYPINDNLNLRSGLSITQKGSEFNADILGLKLESSTNLLYLTIPVLAQYKLNSAGNTPYGLGGLDIGILMSADLESKITGEFLGISFDSDTSFSIKDSLSSTDIALNIGAGYMMERGYSKIYVEILYSLGLLDIDSVDDDVALKTKGIIVGVGYIF
ncbi:MAG: PorT family protein [Candidatus Marinimicrobia bacterium]|nr:PorT family protein [Candidatus Neomarinimicrobiota bacterium]